VSEPRKRTKVQHVIRMVLGISLFRFLSELGYVVPSHSFENMEASLIRGFRPLPEAKISKLTGIQYEGYKLLIASEPCNCRISLGMVPNPGGKHTSEETR